MLVHSGGFLVEAYNVVDTIRTKSAAGTNFRVLVGDSRRDAVRVRSREEGPPSLIERTRSTLEYLAGVAALPGVEIRTHQTALYASQYRFDDSMLVNKPRLRLLGRQLADAASRAGPRPPPVRPLRRRLRPGLGDG